MSAFKGTPGPWEFVPESEEDRYGDVDMGGFRSASGWVCKFGDGRLYYPLEGTPPEPADARLIAAAPELLEALELVLGNGLDSEGLAAAHAKARAAIAKATGENP